MNKRIKSELVHVRLTPQQVAKLQEMGQKTGGLSAAEVIRSMIDYAGLTPVLRPTVSIPVWADNQRDVENYGVGNLTPATAN